MAFAVKAEVRDLRAQTFTFPAQKTMYGGKHVAEGDTVFVFASETDGGHGLIARGVVTSAKAIAKRVGVARQAPRVSISSHGPAARSGPWDGPSSNALPTGMTAVRKPSSISSSTARRRTRSLAYRMRRQRFWMDSSKLNSMRQAERESRRAIRHRVELSAPKNARLMSAPVSICPAPNCAEGGRHGTISRRRGSQDRIPTSK